MQCELKIPDGFGQKCHSRSFGNCWEEISTEVKIYAIVAHTSTRVGTGYSPAKPTDGYRFTIIKEKGKGPSLKIREIEPIPPKCIKSSKFRANIGKRGMCSVCYKQS